MQPLDALTVRAVVHEAKPLLVNRKVDKVLQYGRDEVVLSLRSRAGINHLLLSAHATYGRLCLVNPPTLPRRNNPPSFCMLLRKHLTGATLVGVEQMLGERIVDLVFSCLSEVGAPSLKVLTAEIMGRHSNLIFWDKETGLIVGASHVVTKEMSRQREIAHGLRYVRPPQQERPNLFRVGKEEFDTHAAGIAEALPAAGTVEQWLLNTYAGLGRHLAEELAASIAVPPGTEGGNPLSELPGKLWERVARLQASHEYKPAVRDDMTRFTVLSWYPAVDRESEWRGFPSVNDMIDEYFRHQEVKERFQQGKERLMSELRGERDRARARLEAADRNLGAGDDLAQLKRFGDLILAHIGDIRPGQSDFVCADILSADGHEVVIPLKPELTASQNAQFYYRQFAKGRSRVKVATLARQDAGAREEQLAAHIDHVEAAHSLEELDRARESILGRKPQEPAKAPQRNEGKRPKSRLMHITSADGWTIVVGRNRHENDELISRVAQPQDIWMHVLGVGGAHVLIKMPAHKTDPPEATLKEAAQAAARLSKAVAGGRVRVVYTACKFVRKVPGNKPGVVRYENEKTIEVDTSVPMPHSLKQIFAQRPHAGGRPPSS